jgi:hypothetical protein
MFVELASSAIDVMAATRVSGSEDWRLPVTDLLFSEEQIRIPTIDDISTIRRQRQHATWKILICRMYYR